MAALTKEYLDKIRSISVRTFTPYVSENMGHVPVEITSAKQRDRLCKERGLYIKGGPDPKKPKIFMDYGGKK